MRKTVISSALAAIVVIGAGCSSSSDSTTPEPTTIELFSWWTSLGEKEAFDAVTAVHKARFPGDTVTNLAGPDSGSAHAQLEKNLTSKPPNPPDTFQVNVGADYPRWVLVNGTDAADSKLEPLPAELDSAVFWKELVAATSVDGKYYGVPLNVHRINSLFYNKKLFKELGLKEPSSTMTLEEFNTLCEAIKKKGKIPLALGNVNNWTLQELVFEHIFPGIAGAKAYEDFWHGKSTANSSALLAALDEALILRCGPDKVAPCTDGYVNADSDKIDWQPALDLVMSGDAAMSAMGDWAKGYFEGKGKVAGTDFGVTAFPSKSPVFVYTADSFPLPVGARHRDGAVRLLGTFASIEGQLAFNKVKGSIPARLDINPKDYPDDFDVMRAKTMLDFQQAERGLAMSGLYASDRLVDLGKTLRTATAAGEIETVKTYIEKNYGTLSR